MIKMESRNDLRKKRHRRIRASLSGTAEKPRMCVFRSNKYIYVQIIDDVPGHTLVAASTFDKEVKEMIGDRKSTSNTEAATVLGTVIAKRALDKNIKTVVFDRGGYKYHGNIKALADAARAGGLVF